MASPEFARELAAEADAWVRDGLVTPEQAAALRARYARAAGPARAANVATTVLYATAGILLGAAAIAFILVGLDPREPALPLLVASLALLAAGGALAARDASALLADALLVAALVPLAFTAAETAPFGGALGILALAIPAALLYARRDSPFVPALAALSASVAGGFFLSAQLEAAWPFALWQLLLVAGIVALDRLVRERDATAPALVATAGLAVALLVTIFDELQRSNVRWDSVTVELVAGLLFLAILGAGAGLRHRGVLLAGAVALGADAIIFAFDVGGFLLGTGTLVALAALLVWQAEALRRWFAG